MLEKPDLEDEKIRACLQDDYGLHSVQITFLPLGADLNTAVYRVVAADQTPYFVKLRRGFFDEMSVILPKFLSDQGITQIIPPLVTKTEQLWANLEPFTVIVYPFVEGQDGYEVPLSERLWNEFGSTLKRIHSAEIPPALLSRIKQETYTPFWRKSVLSLLDRIANGVFDDPLVVQLAAFLQTKRDQIVDLVERAERLAQALEAQPPEYIVCHTDLHAGNFLIEPDGTLHIVDWDNPLLAPKERDLMFAGAGLGGGWHTPQAEEIYFYSGYGQTPIDAIALAYYRYERIIQDIAVDCEIILLAPEDSEDREQSFHYLNTQFRSGGVLEIAYASDTTALL